MKARYIDIVKKWAFVFAYGIGEDDVEDVGDWLEALGASRREIARACRVVLEVNKGFTYSNSDLRMSVVCISRASSREQWWDTVAHEVDTFRPPYSTTTRWRLAPRMPRGCRVTWCGK